MRRLLTALIHHCKSAEQFFTISELLIEKLTSAARSIKFERDVDGLDRIIEIIAVVTSVRQGSRVTGAHLSIRVRTFLKTLKLTSCLQSLELFRPSWRFLL